MLICINVNMVVKCTVIHETKERFLGVFDVFRVTETQVCDNLIITIDVKSAYETSFRVQELMQSPGQFISSL
jgi:hypothetical protein